MKDPIERQDAIDAVRHAWAKGLEPTQFLEDLPSAQPEQIARDIATIIENEQDMRVILQNAEHTETHSCENKHTETHDSRREWYMKGYRDAQPRWISVAEQLPEEDIEVLTYDSSFGITFDSLHREKWRKHPVAWMPLPEPYKEGQE